MSRLVNNKRILSLYEAFFSSLVVGLAETYFVAFALHKGVSVIESGLLVSLPLLFAGVTPFLLNNLFNRFYNSTWVLIAMAIQAIAIASLTLIGFFDTHLIFYLLLFIFSIYWFGHFSALPSWNKWVAEFVSHDESQKYFSQRARLTQFGIIGGLIIGGAVLHLEILKVSTSLIFITLFLVSYHLKIAAFYFLYKLPKSVEKYQLDLKKKLVFFIKQKNFFKTYSVFNCSIYLSAPYVSGYLLNIRGLTYIQYMYVMGALFAGKIVTTYVLENFKVNLNPQKIFFIGGLIAAPLPALWPICDSVFAMFLVHFFSGIGWAAWEVGLSLVIYKNIKPSEKIEAVSLYNSVGLPVQVLGTVLGALLLKYVFNNNYNNLFILAGVLRFIFIIPMYYQKYGDENTII